MMSLWTTEIKRNFPKDADDYVGEMLREYVIPHINGYANKVSSPELTKYMNILDGCTSMSAEMLIDLRILLKTLHRVKQKELKEIDKALSLPDSCGYAVGFEISAERVEEIFDELFKEPELQGAA